MEDIIAINDAITVAVVDDHPLFRGGVVSTLLSSARFIVVGEGASASDAIALAAEKRPKVLLLDMNLPGGGLEAAETISAESPETSIVMLTVMDDKASVTGAFKRGARGYLLKGAGGNELLESIRVVAGGDRYVTPKLVGILLGYISTATGNAPDLTVEFTEREEQVLALLSRGMSNKQIAFHLEISEKTVKYYITHVLRKLNARNRVEAALFASHRAVTPQPSMRGH